MFQNDTDCNAGMEPIDRHLSSIALQLFKLPSPSGCEHLVRQYIIALLNTQEFVVSVDASGNILATRGQPVAHEKYPLLSFHMDMVNDYTWRRPLYQPLAQRMGVDEENSESVQYWLDVWNYKRVLPSSAIYIEKGRIHTGGCRILGGDDKCGAAIALAIARNTRMPLKLVATAREERNCQGISVVDPVFFQDVAYGLVLDRQGSQDVVVSINEKALCSPSFAQQMIDAARNVHHHVRAVGGKLSDALTIAHYVRNVVNLSVGYYQPHTLQEYVVVDDLIHSYQWVREALTLLSRL